MPQSPLGSSLPLTENPYNSRVYSQIADEDKKYYMLAFTPGYALQASELNEVQELFFLNQNLTQRMNKNWVSNGGKVPFWDGLIPLNSAGVTAATPTYSNGQAFVSKVNVSSGWYLWTDFTSKLSFWVHLDSNLVSSSTTPLRTTTGTTGEYIGLSVTKSTITCCPAAECSNTQDSTLRDNSQGNTENFFTCGAARLGITFGTELIVRTAASNDFYPILKLTPNTSTQTSTLTFVDGQSVST
jgi:hypothetical protein